MGLKTLHELVAVSMFYEYKSNGSRSMAPSLPNKDIMLTVVQSQIFIAIGLGGPIHKDNAQEAVINNSGCHSLGQLLRFATFKVLVEPYMNGQVTS